MKSILLGAAGFIGTNLVFELAKDKDNVITVVDREEKHFKTIGNLHIPNLKTVQSYLTIDADLERLVSGQDIVYHLVSSTVPTTSNQAIAQEIKENVVFSAKLFDACVSQNVKKVVFLSSGGTVYGKEVECPISEEAPTNPISSYGMQKLMIEKLLYIYHYLFNLDYRVIRLANPYGPYQRPNGIQGAITTFTYKALKNEEIVVYGDGSVVRDYIFIDDAVKGIQRIVNGDSNHRLFNLGCGFGTNIKRVLETIEQVLETKLSVKYIDARAVDVPTNYLDISRYEGEYGSLNPICLEEGIRKTAQFLRQYYDIN